MRHGDQITVQATRNIRGQDFTLSVKADAVDDDGSQSGLLTAIGWLNAQFDYIASSSAGSTIQEAYDEASTKLRAEV